MAKGNQKRKESNHGEIHVESGQVRVVFDAENATEAAVRAFQWSCKIAAMAIRNFFIE